MGGIIGVVANSGKAVMNGNYNLGTVTLTGGGSGVAAGQLLGFQKAANLTNSSNNYALTDGAANVGFTSGGESVALNGSLDTETNPDGISPHSLRKVYGVREYHAHGISAAQAGLQHTDISTTEIYALADWLTDENADKPLLRSDMARILHYIADWLGIPKDRPPR